MSKWITEVIEGGTSKLNHKVLGSKRVVEGPRRQWAQNVQKGKKKKNKDVVMELFGFLEPPKDLKHSGSMVRSAFLEQSLAQAG